MRLRDISEFYSRAIPLLDDDRLFRAQCKPRPVHRTGFTLVEICVVVALLALVTVVAALSVRQPLRFAQHGQILEQIRFLDSTGRARSSAGDDAELRIDQSRGSVSLVDDDGRSIGSPIELPDCLEIVRVLGVKPVRPGVYRVSYDKFGTSHSYAIKIVSNVRVGEWLVVLGLTGQAYRTSNAREAAAYVAESS